MDFKLKFSLIHKIGVASDEVVKILREIAEKVRDGFVEGRVIDGKGDNVGEWVITE